MHQNYVFIEKTNNLLNQSTDLTKKIREAKSTLEKDVANYIVELQDEEIDQLMHQKWFGSLVAAMQALIEEPIHQELDTLKMLHERYADTIDDLDNEIATLEAEFEALMSQLVEVK